MSSGSVRWLRHMLWMSPGSPRKWSPWKCVMKIRPDPHERLRGLEELPLRPLAAIEQDQLALGVEGDRAGRPILGGP